MNPHHTLPTIVDNGFVLWDSHAIMPYLVDKYALADNLYPKDLVRRAKVNQQLHNDQMLFENIRFFYFAPLFYGRPVDSFRLEKAVQGLDVLEQELSGKGYMAGSEMTIADISLLTTITSAVASGHDLKTHPNVAKWIDYCSKEVPGYEEINQKGMDLLKQTMAQRKVELGL
jgi:glutathione S-transferase